MNDENSTDKSPRSPNHSLEDSLGHVKKLHSQIGKGVVKPESAVIALGYKGLNGTALTTLGTLSQYGLIERSKGTVKVTPLAVRLLHPTGDALISICAPRSGVEAESARGHSRQTGGVFCRSSREPSRPRWIHS